MTRFFQSESPLQDLTAMVRGYQKHAGGHLSCGYWGRLIVWKTGVRYFGFGVVWDYMEIIGGRREISSRMGKV